MPSNNNNSPHFKCIVCKTKDANPIYYEYCSSACSTIGLHRNANRATKEKEGC